MTTRRSNPSPGRRAPAGASLTRARGTRFARASLADAGLGYSDLHASARQHLATVLDLSADQCQISRLDLAQQDLLLQQAILMIEQNYVNLPLKQERHGVDPVGRLKALLQSVRNGDDRGDDFHREVTAIFRQVRDRHLSYVIPGPSEECVAFLPFSLAEIREDGERKYIVSQCLLGAADAEFEPGVEIVCWNGVPIERAVSNQAERQSGCNPDARRTQAVKALTLRVLYSQGLPDEQWIAVDCRTLAGAPIMRRFSWEVGTGVQRSLAAVPGRTARDVEIELDVMRRLRSDIFSAAISQIVRFSGKEAPAAALPQVEPDDSDFSFATLNGSGGKAYGYIRIWKFAKKVGGPTQFVNEFVRLLEQVPRNGLIIDIRDNPGGKIVAGERILQTLTSKQIEPELFEFRNTRRNLQICVHGGDDADDDFRRWIPSIRKGLERGEVYSAGFPKTDEPLCNSIGRKYSGPVVLITSALTYSAADIFAAGFQDHGIGRILGVDPTTGAGGAQSWFYSNLENLDLPGSPYDELPQFAELKFALRRSLRVGRNAGKVLEEFGVAANEVHEPTRNDVLNGDVDLVARAISML